MPVCARCSAGRPWCGSLEQGVWVLIFAVPRAILVVFHPFGSAGVWRDTGSTWCSWFFSHRPFWVLVFGSGLLRAPSAGLLGCTGTKLCVSHPKTEAGGKNHVRRGLTLRRGQIPPALSLSRARKLRLMLTLAHWCARGIRQLRSGFR